MREVSEESFKAQVVCTRTSRNPISLTMRLKAVGPNPQTLAQPSSADE